MKAKSLEPYLKDHTFFQDLAEEHIQLLVSCAKNVRFDAGAMIFKQGDPADQFYLIRHGKVAVEISSPHEGTIRIETIGEGEVLGWSWLFPPYVWQFDVSAVELTRAISLDGKCLREKCDEVPELGYDMMKRFSSVMQDRLQATRIRLMDLYAAPKSV